MFLDFILPEQVNMNVFPHKGKKSDCKRVRVKSVFPHIYTRCSRISTFGMSFHKNMGTRMCILMKTLKWQGNAIVFPALITIVLGNAYVLNMCFFCVSSRLKSVAVFLVQAHPNRCFSQKKPSHFEVKSQGRDMRRDLPESQHKLGNNCKNQCKKIQQI